MSIKKYKHSEKTKLKISNALKSRYGTPIQRFFDNIKFPSDLSSCWIWIGCNNGNGYGRLIIDNKKVFAHRFSYELFIKPIPKKMFICHHCDNPQCVNPDHLFIGTQKDNMQDMIKKNRCTYSKVTIKEVLEIRKLYVLKDIAYKQLAKKYSVTEQTIKDIVNKKTWQQI